MKKKKLRNSVKAVIIKGDKLLVIKKKDGISAYAVLPGGGQKKDETLKQALKREVLEEVGAKVKVGKLVHVREYFSEKSKFTYEDRALHQVEFFFECELREDYMPKNGKNPDTRQETVVWVKLNKLDEINFYPVILRKILRNFKNGDAPLYLGECN